MRLGNTRVSTSASPRVQVALDALRDQHERVTGRAVRLSKFLTARMRTSLPMRSLPARKLPLQVSTARRSTAHLPRSVSWV